MRTGFFLAGMILLASLAGPAWAQGSRVPESRVQGVQPLDRILPDVRRSNPGQFFDAQGPIAGPGGSQHYSLKWMTPEGRIEYLDTDARTGRVLRATPGGETQGRAAPNGNQTRGNQGYAGQGNRNYQGGRARER